MNLTKSLIEAKLYTNPTKNLISLGSIRFLVSVHVKFKFYQVISGVHVKFRFYQVLVVFV
jgi:hypothetical protein